MRCSLFNFDNHKSKKSTDRRNTFSDSFALVSGKNSLVIPSVILSKKGNGNHGNGINYHK